MKGYAKTTADHYGHYERLIDACGLTQEGIDEFLRGHNLPQPRAALKQYLEYKEITNIKIKQFKGKARKRIPKFLIKEEVNRLVDNCDLQMKIMILLSFEGGLRANELCSLIKEDLDMTNRRIRAIGKGNKEYIIIFSRLTADLLKVYLEDIPDFSRLFKWKRCAWYKHLKDLGYATLHKKVTPHMLRHSIATHLREQGLDAFELKNYMRHESIMSTAIYTHIRPKAVEEKIRSVFDNE